MNHNDLSYLLKVFFVIQYNPIWLLLYLKSI